MTDVAGASLIRRPASRRGFYAAWAIAELRGWPALSVNMSGDDISVAVAGIEVLQLIDDDRVRLCLTRPVIDRIGSSLRSCGQVSVCPDGAWVILRLHPESDLQLLFGLMSVAIEAHDHR
ncbi:luciferase family protein [Nonomuraea sp. NPDC050404]|uniref:luciferase family protein n=1 Tax=Nonomuraea sp. NPDC050404 TaxID=3155783 RepID=UPI0033D9C7A2